MLEIVKPWLELSIYANCYENVKEGFYQMFLEWTKDTKNVGTRQTLSMQNIDQAGYNKMCTLYCNVFFL